MKITLNEKAIECDGNKTLYDICKDNGIIIPTLCRQENIHPEARCRICLVEMNGKLVTSCSTYPKEGSKIVTDSEKAKNARKRNTELMMANHGKSCLVETKSDELCKLLKEVGLTEFRFDKTKNIIDEAILKLKGLPRKTEISIIPRATYISVTGEDRRNSFSGLGCPSHSIESVISDLKWMAKMYDWKPSNDQINFLEEK